MCDHGGILEPGAGLELQREVGGVKGKCGDEGYRACRGATTRRACCQARQAAYAQRKHRNCAT